MNPRYHFKPGKIPLKYSSEINKKRKYLDQEDIKCQNMSNGCLGQGKTGKSNLFLYIYLVEKVTSYSIMCYILHDQLCKFLSIFLDL